jgi:hypothetical protein
MRNGHYPLPPLRPELQAAHDEMDAKGDYFAYAVCRTHDGQAWEVTTRQGGMYGALDGRYLDHDEAMPPPAWPGCWNSSTASRPTTRQPIGRYGKAWGNDEKHLYSFAHCVMMQ